MNWHLRFFCGIWFDFRFYFILFPITGFSYSNFILFSFAYHLHRSKRGGSQLKRNSPQGGDPYTLTEKTETKDLPRSSISCHDHSSASTFTAWHPHICSFSPSAPLSRTEPISSPPSSTTILLLRLSFLISISQVRTFLPLSPLSHREFPPPSSPLYPPHRHPNPRCCYRSARVIAYTAFRTQDQLHCFQLSFKRVEFVISRAWDPT